MEQTNTTYRGLIWCDDAGLYKHIKKIKSFESQGKLIINGIVNDGTICNNYDYLLIKENEIELESVDIAIILLKNDDCEDVINNQILALGFNENYIIPGRAFDIAGFTFDRYIALKSNTPTIFCPNCWGGHTYHSLGLRFESPTINMFMEHADYIKFLSNPKHYIQSEIFYEKMKFNKVQKVEYPVAICDDIFLHFNHNVYFEDAKKDWERRKQRIKWDNLFVMFYDEDKELVDRFCELPYERKFCLVPYEDRSECVISVNYKEYEDLEELEFWQIVIFLAQGGLRCYDVFELLLNNHFERIGL